MRAQLIALAEEHEARGAALARACVGDWSEPDPEQRRAAAEHMQIAAGLRRRAAELAK